MKMPSFATQNSVQKRCSFGDALLEDLLEDAL